MRYKEFVTGGIPPDPDHLELFNCCFVGCNVTQDDEPLIVAAAGGKMATFCRYHYDLLTINRENTIKG
jgi:hypothetical protein